MRSKIRWFTEFCNSHYVSHFAAFFIVARAKISVVESFSFRAAGEASRALCCFSRWSGVKEGLDAQPSRNGPPRDRLGRTGRGASDASAHQPRLPVRPPEQSVFRDAGSNRQKPGARTPPPQGDPLLDGEGSPLAATSTVGGTVWSPGCYDVSKDPSAGSPTETLLRLLLPLGGRV